MKKLLCLFLSLGAISILAQTYQVGPVSPGFSLGGSGSGGTNPVVETTLYSSNFTTLNTPLVISGSSLANVNGTYTFAYTNVGAGTFGFDLVVWTNSTATWIIAANDPDAPGFLSSVIEPSLGGVNVPYIGSLNSDFLPHTFTVNTGPPADVITVTYATNIIRTPFVYSKVAGSLFSVPNTNVLVDPVGSDLYGAKGLVSFASLAGSVAAGQSNIIIVTSFDYTAGSDINLPRGTRVVGNHSSLNGTIMNITNFNQIYDITTDVQPTVNITNVLSKSIMDVHVEDTTDYMVINNVAGFLQYLNPRIEGTWDGLIIDSSNTNSFIQMNNPLFKLEQDRLTGVTWGMHGVGYKVSSTTGSRVQIVGGVISVLNSTNTTFSGTEIQGNACIYVGQKSGTSGNGNASIELYGTALIHGSTNAGASTHAISNVVNVPIHGMYFDVIPGADSTKPVVSAQMHSFDGIRTPVIVVTKTASYTVTTNEFNKRFNNSGASGAVTFSLPSAIIGATYVFKVTTAQSLVIDADTSDTIQYNTSVTAASGAINSATIGSSIILTCESANKWFAEAMVGTWSP